MKRDEQIDDLDQNLNFNEYELFRFNFSVDMRAEVLSEVSKLDLFIKVTQIKFSSSCSISEGRCECNVRPVVTKVLQ